ncbi:MAG: hypothetical protein L3J14_04055 [Flavobacteriaceae bacterium]|nr:hypothetical protein [Flavobacteriaceae bacterium]
MKKLLFIFVLIPLISFAQNQRALRFSYYIQPVEIDFQKQNSDIDGHKYFLDSWNSGTIIVNDTIILPQKKILYNLVTERLIVGEKGSNKAHVITDVSISGFIINNNNFIMLNKEKFLDPTVGNSFFLLPEVSKSPYLIIKYRKKIKEAPVSNGYNNSSGYKKYVQTSEYYILGKEKKYIKTKLKKKNILKILNDKSSKVKAFASSNKINFNKERDVMRILDYYHTL